MRLFLLSLLLAANLAQGQTSVPMDAAALAMQQQADALIQPDGVQVRGARIAWPEWIHEFYAKRSFKPVWTRAHVSQELQRAITDSRLDGLDPADYHLPLLQLLSAEVAAPGATDMVRAQFDVLQTDAVLRLGYHLSFGKVDPETFDAQWNYGRTLEHFDAAQEIEAALAADDIYARIAALKPTHRIYLTLKEELQRYRIAEAAGGWAAIPAGAKLKLGAPDARVAALRARLATTGDLDAATGAAADNVYDATLAAAVGRFQERMGMANDGVVGARTLEELNVPVGQRILQLRINLDRGRLLLQDLPPQFLVVNIAGYQIYLMRGENIVWTSRVQVGKPFRQTPMFRSAINYLVLNPTWTVPPGIIEKDILPAARRDPGTFAKRGLSVLDSKGQSVDPASVDWSRYRSGNIPYTLRQDPGPANALGRVKFMFPNAYSVYLHDTPSKSLFDAADRSFSSGCVRVEKPMELAKLLLNDPQQWNDNSIAQIVQSEKLQNVTLKEKMPVLLAYWTAWVDSQGRANYRRDIYGQDAQWAKGLDADFRIRKRPLTVAVTPAPAQAQRD